MGCFMEMERKQVLECVVIKKIHQEISQSSKIL